MTFRIDISGEIIPTDDKELYSWFGIDATCPKDVTDVVNQTNPGDAIDVYINSPGGSIDAGSEIYTTLREAAASRDVKIHITGEACSAASVIACAAYCEMSPTALMMVHCVSASGVSGNHNDMDKMSEILQTADEALCSAYMAKAGMNRDEAIAMMEAETWLTAEQAKEKGLVDAVMFENEPVQMVAGPQTFSEAQLSKMRAIMQKEKDEKAHKKQRLTLRLETLKLKHID